MGSVVSNLKRLWPGRMIPSVIDEDSFPPMSAARSKRLSRGAIAAAVLMATGLTASSTANADDGVMGPYKIFNRASGMVVDVPTPGTENKFTHLWPYWGGTNQQFDLVEVEPDNPKSDVLLRVRNSGKCLDVNNAVLDSGARVQTFPCTGTPSQRWFLEPVSPSGDTLVVRARHSGQCLDAANPEYPTPAPQGAAIQQWPCNRTANQIWEFYRV